MGLYLKDNTDKIKLLAGGATRTWVGTYDAYLEAKDSIPESTVIMITDKEADTTSEMPIGSIINYEGETAPDGWLFTDGSTFDATKYPKLYQLLGSDELPESYDVASGIDESTRVYAYESVGSGNTFETITYTVEQSGVLTINPWASTTNVGWSSVRYNNTLYTTTTLDNTSGPVCFPYVTKGDVITVEFNKTTASTVRLYHYSYKYRNCNIIKATDPSSTTDYTLEQTSAIINTSVDKAKDYTRRRKGEFTYTTNSRFNAPQDVHVWQEGSSVHIQMNFTNKAAGNNTWIEQGTITGVDLPTGTRWCGIAESGGVAWPIRVTADGIVQVFAGGTLLASNTTGVQACYYADGIDEE